MFDLPIPQPVEEPAKPLQQPPLQERFSAEALEYESDNNRARKKSLAGLVPALFTAVAGVVFGYLAHSTEFGNVTFTTSLLASAVFLYVFRR